MVAARKLPQLHPIIIGREADAALLHVTRERHMMSTCLISKATSSTFQNNNWEIVPNDLGLNFTYNR